MPQGIRSFEWTTWVVVLVVVLLTLLAGLLYVGE